MDASQLLARLSGPMPFARLAHTHALSTAADAFFAVSLAGSLFFNVSVDAARPRILLYLALTMAPFALLAPLVGPLVDRFGQARTSLIGLTVLARGILCLFIAGDLKNLLFYPEAFAVLVLGKGYSVAKSAAVPGLVDDPSELVAANSRLSRVASLSGVVGAAVAAGVMALGDAPLVLRLGSLVYFAGAALALRIPSPDDPPVVTRQEEQSEVQSPAVLLGSSVLSVLRASIGFLTFLVAFGFRRASEPVWLYGAVLFAVGLGNFAATILTPLVKRRWLREEQLFAAALLVAGAATIAGAVSAGNATQLVAGAAIGLGANVGRQAFDSVLQRDAPDAARGRYFARFETRFQLAWVAGALVPVVVTLSPRAGLAVLGAVLVVTLVSFLAGVSLDRKLAGGLRHLIQRRTRSPAPGSSGGA